MSSQIDHLLEESRRFPPSAEFAAQSIDEWCRYVLPRQFQQPQGWQLQNMLTVARLMVEAALVREESRGVHYRGDFPDTDPAWKCHLNFRRGFEMWREPVS